jgi:type IV secretory pathway VirB10-like protein
MNLLRATLLCLAVCVPVVAGAQWRWLDKNGRTVFSDQPPPQDIPVANIVGQPRASARKAPASDPAAAASAASAAAAPPKPPASAAKLSGRDKDLMEKKKQAEAAEAEKRSAQVEELAKARAENCARAKRSKATFDSGARVARTNEKGEREYLDDAGRAAEVKRLEGVIASDCKPAGG